MKLEQISVFLENRPGGLAEITGALSQAGVNIRALSLADTADFGILRLIVDRNEIAIRVLKESGFTVGLTEMVALEIPDRIGGLWGILTLLEAAGMNVEYMYAFVQKAGENAVILFRFDEPARAAQMLREAGVRVLEGEDVYAM
ncbi:MAG: ACT domain-containing protein [candidate division NC10 bacterium]|nr:ACT domain-containing protein [candidate division NC10 bacterium]